MTAQQGRFAGRVAVVTGAAGGIGRGVALRLAAEGAAVAAVDRDADGVAAVATEIEKDGGTATAVPADLADTAARARVVPDVVAALGRVDVLVNNAATLGARRALTELDEDDWSTVLDTNLTATAFLCRDAVRDMLPRGTGAVVNVTSLQEQLPLPTHIAYVASKGGISALTRALAVELGHTGVRVNAVVPGMIGSPGLTDEFADAGSSGDAYVPNLVGRLGTPDEVAGVVAYLASDDAAYVTGALWQIDGGRSLSREPDPLMTTPPQPHEKD